MAKIDGKLKFYKTLSMIGVYPISVEEQKIIEHIENMAENKESIDPPASPVEAAFKGIGPLVGLDNTYVFDDSVDYAPSRMFAAPRSPAPASPPHADIREHIDRCAKPILPPLI